MLDFAIFLVSFVAIILIAIVIYHIHCAVSIRKTLSKVKNTNVECTKKLIAENNKFNKYTSLIIKYSPDNEAHLIEELEGCFKIAALVAALFTLVTWSCLTTLLGLIGINISLSSTPTLLTTILDSNNKCECYAKCTGDPEDDKKTAYELIFGPAEYEKLVKDMLYTCTPAEQELFEKINAGDSGKEKSKFIQLHINAEMVADYKNLVSNYKNFKHNDGINRCDLDDDALKYDLIKLFGDVKTNGRNVQCKCCQNINQNYLYDSCEGMPHWTPGWSWEENWGTNTSDAQNIDGGTLSAYMTIDGISGYLWIPEAIDSNTALIWCMPGMSSETKTVEKNAAYKSVKEGYVKPKNAVFFVDYTVLSEDYYKGSEVTAAATTEAIADLKSTYLNGIGDKLYYYGFSQGAWLYGDGGFSTLGFSEVILGDGGDPQTIQIDGLQRVLVTQAFEDHIDEYNVVFSSLGDNYTMVNMRDITKNHTTANFYTASNNTETFKGLATFIYYDSELPEPKFGLTWFTESEVTNNTGTGGDYNFTASDQEMIDLFKSLGYSERKAQGMTACFKACTDQGMSAYEAIGLISCASCEGEPGLVQFGFPSNSALYKDTSGELFKSSASNHLYIDSSAKRKALASVQSNGDSMGIGTAQWTNGRCATYLSLMETHFGDQAVYSESDLFDFDYAMYSYDLGPNGSYHALANNIKNHNSSLEAVVVYSMFYYEAGFGNYKNSDVIQDYYDASKDGGGWKYKYLNNRYTNAQAIDAAFKAKFGGGDSSNSGPVEGDLTDACKAICQSYINGIPSGQKIYVSKDTHPSAKISYGTFQFTYNGHTTSVQPYSWSGNGPWYRCCNGLASAVLSVYRGQPNVTYLSCADLANGGTTISNNNQATKWGDLRPGDIIGLQYNGSGFGHVEVVLKNDGTNVYIGNAGSDTGIKKGAQNGYSSSHPVNESVVKYYLDNYNKCTFVKIARYN